MAQRQSAAQIPWDQTDIGFRRRRPQADVWETLPDGTPMSDLGMPAWMRPGANRRPVNADIGERGFGQSPSGDDRLSGEGGAELASRMGAAPQGPVAPDATIGLDDPGARPEHAPYSMQPDPMATATDGRLMTPAEQRLNDALGQYGEAINRKPVDQNGRGKSILKGIAYGASHMGDRPVRTWADFGQQAGKAIGGGIGGAIHPAFDEELQQQEDIGRRGQYLKAAEGAVNIESNAANRQSQVTTRAGQLDLNKEKEANRVLYQQEKINLGKDNADKLFDYRNQIVALRARGLDQNDTRIQQLQDRIDETVRHNTKTEAQGDAKISISRTMADLAKIRTDAYAEAVKKSGNKAAGKQAQDAAESQFWKETADDYEKKAQQLDKTGDSEEAAKMRTRAITAREKGGKLGVRSSAAQQ